MAHPGLGGEMDDGGDIGMGRDHACHRRAVGDVDGVEAERRLPGQAVQSGLLQAHVVIAVEVVDADHLLAAGQQRHGDMVTDEPGSPSQQNRQDALLTTMRV